MGFWNNKSLWDEYTNMEFVAIWHHEIIQTIHRRSNCLQKLDQVYLMWLLPAMRSDLNAPMVTLWVPHALLLSRNILGRIVLIISKQMCRGQHYMYMLLEIYALRGAASYVFETRQMIHEVTWFNAAWVKFLFDTSVLNSSLSSYCMVVVNHTINRWIWLPNGILWKSHIYSRYRSALKHNRLLLQWHGKCC